MLRQERIERQKALGILPRDFQPAKSSSLWPRWRALNQAQQKQESRRMAVYAAMLDVMDQNIGKVITQLKASDQYDNTVIISRA